MKPNKYIVFIFGLFLNIISNAQINFNYQAVLGGDSAEYMYKDCMKKHNSFVYLASNSYSKVSGNKTVGVCNNQTAYTDMWIQKMDEQHQVVNQVSLGGNRIDAVGQLLIDSINNYIYCIGGSYSNVSCNKSQPRWDVLGDVWVVKLDLDLNIIWDKRFGGTSYEDKYCATIDLSGNLVVAVHTGSNVPSGDITVAPLFSPSLEAWLIRIDPNGNLINQKFIGYGALSGRTVYINNIESLSNGDFILIGSLSGYIPSGTAYVQSSPINTYDVGVGYFLRLDSALNYVTDRRFGGVDSAYLANPTGANKLLIGMGNPYIDGNKIIICGYSKNLTSSNLFPMSHYGKADAMILVTDLYGNLISNYAFGGSEDDYAINIKKDSQGNYYVFALSKSNISGVKSDNSKGGSDFWLLKLDSNMNKIADYTIGTTKEDVINTMTLIDDTLYGAMTVDYTSGGDFTLPTFNQASEDIWFFTIDPNNIVTGLTNVQSNISGISVYPNPTTGLFTIKGLKANSPVDIYTIDGKLLFSAIVNNDSQFNISLEGFSNGVYLLRSNEKAVRIIKN